MVYYLKTPFSVGVLEFDSFKELSQLLSIVSGVGVYVFNGIVKLLIFKKKYASFYKYTIIINKQIINGKWQLLQIDRLKLL